MPRKLKKAFKYKCLELMCNTVHRHDKWLEHCKKKHLYKFKNNIDIKYKITEEKEGDGPWMPYMGRGERSMDDEPQPSTSAQSSAIERYRNITVTKCPYQLVQFYKQGVNTYRLCSIKLLKH